MLFSQLIVFFKHQEKRLYIFRKHVLGLFKSCWIFLAFEELLIPYLFFNKIWNKGTFKF